MRLLLCAIASCVLAGLAFAAPGGAGVDERLDRKVTCRYKGELLHKVVSDISRQTGVALYCGTSSRNWQVRDRKVTVFVKDMPLRDLQAHLASVTHFTWNEFQGKSGRYYRLVQTAKQKREEQSLLNGSPKANAAKQSELADAALTEINRLSSLSPDAVIELRKKNAWLYCLAKHPVGEAFSQLLAQVPEARQALLEHRTTNIPIDSLPPEATATVKKFVEAADDFARQVEPDYAAGGPATPISLEGRYISINNAPAVADESLAAMVIGVIHVDAGRFGMLPIYDATSPYAKAAGGIYARILDGEDPKKAYGKDQGNSAIIQAMAEAGIVADFPPDDPIFSKTVKLTRFDRGLSGAIEDICSQVEGIQIISDHFRPEPGLPDINPSGQAGQVVSQLAVFCGKKLERKGSTLLMVDREWFLKRPKEIPEALLDRLVNARRGEGLTLANAAEIAACTDEQIEASIQNHESGLLVGTGWHMRQPEVKGIARLYGSLSTEERESLDSKDGLDVSLLSQAQMALLAAAVAAAEWGHGIPESPLRLHHSARGREHEFVLTETAQTPEDNSSAQERSDTSSRFAVSWTVMLY